MQFASVEDFVAIADVAASLVVGAEAEVEVVATCDADGRTLLVDGFGTPIHCTVTNWTDSTDGIAVVATVDGAGAVSYEVV